MQEAFYYVRIHELFFLSQALLSRFEGIFMYISFGTCFPSSCSSEDNLRLVSTLLAVLKIPLVGVPLSCYTDEKPDFDAADYSVM